MFELNDRLDVKVVRDVKGRSIVVIDDFYKDPGQVRDLCLSTRSRGNDQLVNGLPGRRVFVKTNEVRENLQDIFFKLCGESSIWLSDIHREQDIPFKHDLFFHNWKNIGFMCNVINDSTLIQNPVGIIPHQDRYSDSDVHLYQYGAVVYLNTPEECAGGTNFYSFKDKISISSRPPYGEIPVPDNADEMSDEDRFRYVRSNIDSGGLWKVECQARMVYNRLVLYEADILHSQNIDLGMFTDYNRINQIFFM
tara:strand:+ start:132 stop:884 length:753 start_codon:yes stop_codon:yes gene_type:complete